MPSVNEYEAQLTLVTNWLPLALAAGIDTRGKTPMDLLLLGGRIVKDSEVARRVAPKAQEWMRAVAHVVPGEVPVPLPNGIAELAVREMTAEEKAALRKRVGA